MHNYHESLPLGRLLLLIGGFLLLLPFWGKAQDELSLRDLINRALEENYQIRIYKNIAETAENRNTIGNAGMLPNLNLIGETRTAINNSRQQFFTGDSQQATNARRNSLSTSLQANWIVFDGLAMFARKEQFERLAALSEADTRFFIEQTVADLATAYYQLRQETQLLAAYQKTLEVSEARLAFEEKAYEIGASNLLNLQLARVDQNTDRSLILNQEAQIQEIALAINRLITRELTAPITPIDSIRLAPEFDLSGLLQSTRSNNASLNQQQLNELATASQFDILRGALFPQVEIYGNFGFDRQVNEVGFLQSSRTFGPEFGIRVRFNLYSGGSDKIASQNAQINLETEQLRTQELNIEVERSLRAAHLRWLNHAQRARLERESVREANDALKIAQRQYELGALTNVDFRVIQLNAINAETRFLEAQFAAKVREIELLRLSGRLVEEML